MTCRVEDHLTEKEGTLYWKKIPHMFRRSSIGGIAGYTHYSGYKYVKLSGKVYPQSHVVWYLTFGIWPKRELDHINSIKSDNRIDNLRLATRSQNQANVNKKGGTSKYNGVSWKTKTSRWIAQSGGKHLGSFTCEKEAALCYNYAAIENFGEYAWLNQVFEDVELDQENGK